MLARHYNAAMIAAAVAVREQPWGSCDLHIAFRSSATGRSSP